MYHGRNAAARAEKHFESVFAQGALPEIMPEFTVATSMGILDLLVATELAPSKGEARRLIEQGGVKLGDVVVTDIGRVVGSADCPSVLQKGKRYFVKLVA